MGIEWMNNSEIRQFLKPNFRFPNSKNSANLLIFQLGKFGTFLEL